MTHTPRRTIRMSDEEWSAGHTKAQSQGETITEVLRRLLAGYLVSDSSGLDYGVEYRAVPKDADSSLAVDLRHGYCLEVRDEHRILDHGPVDSYTPQDARDFAAALLAAADDALGLSFT